MAALSAVTAAALLAVASGQAFSGFPSGSRFPFPISSPFPITSRPSFPIRNPGTFPIRTPLPFPVRTPITFPIDDPPTPQGGQLVEQCGQSQGSCVTFPGANRQRRQATKQINPGSRGSHGILVVGGENATPSKWPWMALLGFTEGGRLQWKCGGTLLSSRLVLTAAHCVRGRQPAELTVRLGEYNLDTTRDNQHQDLAVSRIIVHPSYSSRQNDIALLVLASEARFGCRVQPVCLPPPDADHTGQDADLAGWGRLTYGGNVSQILQQVQIRVVDEGVCERTYSIHPSFRQSFPGGFQGTKVCANGADGTSRDACQGDSGGPLVVRGSDSRYQVIGVVSVGFGCGNPDYPGIYTKVSKYIPWILRHGALV